jgi:hypothetical protein
VQKAVIVLSLKDAGRPWAERTLAPAAAKASIMAAGMRLTVLLEFRITP